MTESSIPCVRMEIGFVVAAVGLGNPTVSSVSASAALAESVSPGLDYEANNLPPLAVLILILVRFRLVLYHVCQE